MSRGDRVEIAVDIGTGVQTYEIEATRAGRRVEVSEVTRSGTVVRTARFMTARVVALVEHPVDGEASEVQPRRRRRSAIEGQGSLT